MGSVEPTAKEGPRDIHVLVTGFGLFRDHPANTSWMIASTLPQSTKFPGGKVHIHTLPGAIEVSYKRIRATVPGLLFPRDSKTPNYDVVLHIGMADKRDFYAVETQAHRDDYVMKDATGKSHEGDVYWKEEFGAPAILTTGIDPVDVLKKWKLRIPEEDLRLSDDAGRYLCEFTHYTSMIEYWRKDPHGECPVVFLHVPGKADDASIETGRKITLGLIGSLAEIKARM